MTFDLVPGGARWRTAQLALTPPPPPPPLHTHTPRTRTRIHTARALTGDIAKLQLHEGIQKVYIGTTAIKGDLTQMTMPSTLEEFQAGGSWIEGDLKKIVLPGSMEKFIVWNTKVTGGPEGLANGSLGWDGMTVPYQKNGLSIQDFRDWHSSQ